VTIVEFGDFACPFCQEAATGTRKLLADYKDKVKLIFRDYPLHDNSIDLASAARCAGEQGKFWETYDALYANQDKFTATTSDALSAQLSSLASFLKLNTSQFNECLISKKYVAQIRKDYEDGEKLQISGTPTWFINNYSLTGYVPADKFRELVTGLMK
jgi:protein-disulfide isomerase